MEPNPTFKHDGEKDVPEFFLYRKPPSLAQPIAPVLTLPGDKHVRRQEPCTIISTSQELSAATSIPVPAAEVESDVSSLFGDEGIAPVLTLPGDGPVYRHAVPGAIHDSLDEPGAVSSHLRTGTSGWGVELRLRPVGPESPRG